jgi:hypothetical protein
MWKAALIATTAVAITGTSLVYAQQQHRPGPRGGAEAGAQWRPSPEDAAAFADARIAALKAGLRLTPEQEKNWANFETALRDLAKARHDRRMARPNEQPPSGPVERLHRQADALSNAGAMLKRLATAEEPLYSSFDEGQKRRFHVLSRMLQPHRQMAMRGSRGQGRAQQERGQEWRGGDRPEGGARGMPPQGPRGQRGREG